MGICSRDFVRNMKMGPLDLVSYHSDYMTLHPGDPDSRFAGCPKGARIKAGDHVGARIEGVGHITAKVKQGGKESPVLKAVSCSLQKPTLSRRIRLEEIQQHGRDFLLARWRRMEPIAPHIRP